MVKSMISYNRISMCIIDTSYFESFNIWKSCVGDVKGELLVILNIVNHH